MYGTHVFLKYKGVPMERLYAYKLDIFGIYDELRSELNPNFKEDIYIVKILRFMNPIVKILDEEFNTTSFTKVPIPGMVIPVKAGYWYTVEGMFSAFTTIFGADFAIDFPSSEIANMQYIWTKADVDELRAVNKTAALESPDMGVAQSGWGENVVYLRGSLRCETDGDLTAYFSSMVGGINARCNPGSWLSARLVKPFTV